MYIDVKQGIEKRKKMTANKHEDTRLDISAREF